MGGLRINKTSQSIPITPAYQLKKEVDKASKALKFAQMAIGGVVALAGPLLTPKFTCVRWDDRSNMTLIVVGILGFAIGMSLFAKKGFDLLNQIVTSYHLKNLIDLEEELPSVEINKTEDAFKAIDCLYAKQSQIALIAKDTGTSKYRLVGDLEKFRETHTDIQLRKNDPRTYIKIANELVQDFFTWNKDVVDSLRKKS